MAANFQSPEMVAVVSSSLILSVMVLISFRMSSSSSFTGGDIEKVSSSVLGGDLQQRSSLRSQDDLSMFYKPFMMKAIGNERQVVTVMYRL